MGNEDSKQVNNKDSKQVKIYRKSVDLSHEKQRPNFRKNEQNVQKKTKEPNKEHNQVSKSTPLKASNQRVRAGYYNINCKNYGILKEIFVVLLVYN